MTSRSSKIKRDNPIDISEKIEMLNEKIDSNTQYIQLIDKKITKIMKKINNIEKFVKESLSDQTNNTLPRQISDDDEENEFPSFFNNKKSPANKPIKEPIPKHKPTKPQKTPKRADKKQSSNISIKDDTIDVQKELTRSRNAIEVMEKSISLDIDRMGKTYVYDQLSKMGCFTKIVWNEKTDETENITASIVEKFDLYTKDYENNKYYFEIKASNGPKIKLTNKLQHTYNNSILVKVTNVLTTPKANYYLYLDDKNYQKIYFDENVSFVDSIAQLKDDQNPDKNEDDDDDIVSFTSSTNLDESDDDNDDDEEMYQKKTKKQLTNSVIMRKLKKIRRVNNKKEGEENYEDFDAMEELTKSRQRIQNMENCISFNIGYMGEAYVYENLMSMKCFTNVVWNAKTNDPKNPCVFIKNGKQFHIKEDGGHYDIYAEDGNNIKYYFEIKSSLKEHAKGKPSNEQKKLAKLVNKKNEIFIVVKVANVLDVPKINYSVLDRGKKYLQIDVKGKESFVDAVYRLKKIKFLSNEVVDSTDDDDDDNDDDEFDVKDDDYQNNGKEKFDDYDLSKNPECLIS